MIRCRRHPLIVTITILYFLLCLFATCRRVSSLLLLSSSSSSTLSEGSSTSSTSSGDGRNVPVQQQQPLTTGSEGEGTCNAATGECDKYGITSSNITNCLLTEQSTNRPTYNDETFRNLRNVYRNVQTQYPNDMSEIEGEEMGDYAGIVVPFAIQTIPGTSYRGVFATESIQEGDYVWSPLFFGTFATEESWLSFLYAIMAEYGNGNDDDNNNNNDENKNNINLGKFLACDALQWSYVMESGDGQDFWYHAVLDLDEGSFVNHGWTETGQANIVDGFPDEYYSDSSYYYDDEEQHKEKDNDLDFFCDSCMRAVRDISAGEQIMTDYAMFYIFGQLEWYEASVAKAWDVDRSLRTQDKETQWHYR